MTKKALMVAGGTGGHVFPALAIANALEKEGFEIEWLGSKKGMEGAILKNYHYHLHAINVASFRGRGALGRLCVAFILVKALFASVRLLRRIKPNVVVGTGGFVSFSGCMGAYFLRIPMVIHEQNVIAGRANRLLASMASLVLETHPETFSECRGAVTVGNPAIFAPPCGNHQERRGYERPRKRLRLLVVGGSQGAKILNRVIVGGKWTGEVWLQCGSAHYEKLMRELSQGGSRGIRLSSFIEDMQAAYAWADIVVARAGASTLGELMLMGRANILVPLAVSAQDHQRKNAEMMVKAGASIVIEEAELSTERLQKVLAGLSPKDIVNMGQSARAMARPYAARDAMREIIKLVGS